MSAGRLLVISLRKEDFELGEALSEKLGFSFKQCADRNHVRNWLIDHPDAVVFWNADSSGLYEPVIDILPKYAATNRIFALTERELVHYPHLYRNPTFRHQVFRRDLDSVVKICPALVRCALTRDPVRIERFFPKTTVLKRIFITRSAHRAAAIEAIQNSLTKQGVRGRIAALVAEGVDELIMNAVFHAPVNPDGSPRVINRVADFELDTREQVEVELAESEHYLGFSVGDLFGSFRSGHLISALRRQYDEKKTTQLHLTAGLGFHKIMAGGLSLVMATEPNKCTRAMLFFPRTDSYKHFRTGFRFLSIFAE
ncbi:MAG TPA: hypothetical protein VJB59_10190 [Bdellovibrionota bacterium]|nr:hypothetical protein [Bdellovibrionota bacterium]